MNPPFPNRTPSLFQMARQRLRTRKPPAFQKVENHTSLPDDDLDRDDNSIESPDPEQEMCQDECLSQHDDVDDCSSTSLQSSSSSSSSCDAAAAYDPSPLWKVVVILPILLIALAVTIAVVGRTETNELFAEKSASHQDHWLHDAPAPNKDTRNSVPRTTPLYGKNNNSNNNTVYMVSKQAATQITNYRDYTALCIHVQLPSTAGHAVCQALTGGDSSRNTTTSYHHHHRSSPDCVVHQQKHQSHKTQNDFHLPVYYPWNHHETAANIQATLDYFDTVSWPLPSAAAQQLSDTNWEHDHLVSLVVLRNPLESLLARHHQDRLSKKWPAVFADSIYKPLANNKTANNIVLHQFWDFAKSPYTDNRLIRTLLRVDQDEKIRDTHVQQTQALLERFSILLDMTCLEEGLVAVGDVLGLSAATHKKRPADHVPVEQRMPVPVYQYLKRKNQWDLRVYQWAAVHRVLVPCNKK